VRLGDLVERFGGQLLGNPDLVVASIAPLDNAGPTQISFLSNSKLRALAAQSEAAALILSPLDDPSVAATYPGARIVTTNPYAYFARAAQYFVSREESAPAPGIHPSAVIDPSAEIDPSAHIGPHVTIEAGAVVKAGAVIDHGCFVGKEAVVGEGTRLFANVTFHRKCIIGARGIVHSGAVIIRDTQELESLLTGPHRGRTAWVILASDPAREPSLLAREVAQALMAAAAEVRRPPDGRVVLRVQL